MKQHRRRFVAFLVGRMMGNTQAQSVFDCALSAQTGFSGNISSGGIFLLDLESRRRIVGQRNLDRVLLSYDAENIDLTLSENDKTFQGIDVESQHQFHGVVSGSSVTIFDEEENKDFTFTL